MIRRNLIVVDDFLENPDGVRSYAMEQQFERLGVRTGLEGIALHLMGRRK